MGAAGYAVIGLIAALAAVCAFALFRRLRPKRPDLVIHITAPDIKPVNKRPEWYLDFVAEFANVSHRPLSISAVRAAVSAPKQPPLDAKRILGDEEGGAKHRPAHPPDIALRLPIPIEPGKRVNYRFHIFFSVHLRRMWDHGLLHLYAGADGDVFEGVRVLAPPESGAEIPAAE